MSIQGTAATASPSRENWEKEAPEEAKTGEVRDQIKHRAWGTLGDLSLKDFPFQREKRNPKEINLLTPNTYEIHCPNTLLPSNTGPLRIIIYYH